MHYERKNRSLKTCEDQWLWRKPISLLSTTNSKPQFTPEIDSPGRLGCSYWQIKGFDCQTGKLESKQIVDSSHFLYASWNTRWEKDWPGSLRAYSNRKNWCPVWRGEKSADRFWWWKTNTETWAQTLIRNNGGCRSQSKIYSANAQAGIKL